ncbi:MAG: TIGR03546 family protein [Nitrospinaceae bacterium]|jgi:uncharacterized protein (TIGR03546 family)|nr:MAG: TIGR03546 family protein [Nitrospinaceae bacterium]
MLGPVLKVFKALNSNARPWQLSLGVVFGMLVGLTPLSSPHNLVVVFLAFIINLNLGLMILSFAFFSGVAYLLDPLFHSLGYGVLTAEGLNDFWTRFFSCPVFLLGKLNNSIVMGSLLVSLALAVPVFLLFNVVVSQYREQIQARLKKYPILGSLKIVKLYETLMGGRS